MAFFIEERNMIVNSLIEKTQLQQHEKEEIRKQLHEKEIEITRKNSELSLLRHRLHSEENEIECSGVEGLPEAVIKILVN